MDRGAIASAFEAGAGYSALWVLALFAGVVLVSALVWAIVNLWRNTNTRNSWAERLTNFLYVTLIVVVFVSFVSALF